MGVVIPFPDRGYEPFVDERTAARHFAVSPRTLRNWRAKGAPSHLLSGNRRYRLGELENWARGALGTSGDDGPRAA